MLTNLELFVYFWWTTVFGMCCYDKTMQLRGAEKIVASQY